MSGLDLEKTYFEEHAAEILAAANMNKAQFAKEMGVLPQNINKLIATKNALLLTKVATVLNTTIQFLLYGNYQDDEVEQCDVHGCIYINNTPHIFNNRAELDELLKQE